MSTLSPPRTRRRRWKIALLAACLALALPVVAGAGAVSAPSTRGGATPPVEARAHGLEAHLPITEGRAGDAYAAGDGEAAAGEARATGVRTRGKRISLSSEERQLRAAAAATLRRNYVQRQLVVYPSPAYYNPYLRDSFWVAQAMDDRLFSVHVLDVFASAERADGEPPTWFINAYRYPQYHDDESAALVLIWAWHNQELYGVTPPRITLQRALAYLLRRTRDGALVSAAGTYASWWDAYRLPRPDVLSYNQGLYAVAVRCARGLGLALPPHAIARAEQAYRAMYDPRLGYLTVGKALAASDASALTGEFLSLWLFKRPILTDTMVLSTVRHLSPFGAGFRVVAAPGSGDEDGAGLISTHDYGQPGDYQNGGSWLLYDALSIGAAGLHGQPHALARLRARLAEEFRHGVVLHEYLQTNPTLPYYGFEPPWRDKFSWDTFALVVDRVLRAHATAG